MTDQSRDIWPAVGGLGAMRRRLLFAAALTLSTDAALADGGKTVPGRCLAVIDGHMLLDDRGPRGDWCSITFTTGGAFRFWKWGLPEAFEVRPENSDGGGEAIHDLRNDAAGDRVPIGPVKRDGACWAGARAKLCAWSGEAEMLRNRDAPYTAFHTLLGRDVKAGCDSVSCRWFRYDHATILDHDDREAIVKADGESWSTDASGKGAKRLSVRFEPSSFYRCSRTRPAVINHYVDGWKLQPLAPDGILGASALARDDYAGYAAACDGLDHAVVAEEGVQLGYHTDDAAEDYSDNTLSISGLDAALK